MFINMRTVDVVQMAIVQIVGVAIMIYGQMTATRTMLMVVIVMFVACIHTLPPVIVSLTVNL